MRGYIPIGLMSAIAISVTMLLTGWSIPAAILGYVLGGSTSIVLYAAVIGLLGSDD